MRVFKIFFVSILLIISSCSGMVPSSKLSVEEKAKIKNIGVYSALDNTMHIFLAGAHSYDNIEKEIKMPAWWNLNKAAKNTASEKLKDRKVGRIKSDTLIYDTNQILRLASDQNFDTAILILPKTDKNNPALKAGYGMFRYSQEIQKGYISFSIDIYDVKTKSLIKSVAFDNDPSQEISFNLPLDFREYFNYHRDEVEKLMHSYEGEIALKTESALTSLGF